jgi:uncharacterized membrane protein YgdD (TMEM256/DUF423 family)
MMDKNRISPKVFVWAGSLVTGLAVVLGALGAHWLKEQISMLDMQSFETAIRYQLIHGLAILILGALPKPFHGLMLKLVFHFFWIGVLLFSGSIYLLATRDLTMLPLSWLGPVTPIGGLFMITGWVLLFVSSIRLVGERDEEH